MEENNPIQPVQPAQPTNPADSPLNQGYNIQTPQTTAQTPSQNPVKSSKKYIIIALVIILLGAIGVFAYQFLGFKPQAEPETTTQNTLYESQNFETPDQAEMEELEDVVDELKDIYEEEAPPSLNLTIPAENSSENSGKIAR